ncbi:hypothetical protein KNE206_71290 [Kitasatospora sp. NE20-6]|uniref:TIGR02391 family protein n=1 Tax=Kitasatospora sp. NE20-6 TaxID=2859066 RepID=UPI0034DBA1F7
MRVMVPEGLPRPKGDSGFELLEAVHAYLVMSGKWPSFDYLDRHLWRENIRIEDALAELPRDLILGYDTEGGYFHNIQDQQEISLTPAGLANCAGGRLQLRAMFALLDHAVQVERNWGGRLENPGARPIVTERSFGEGRDPQLVDRVNLFLAAEVASNEPWTAGFSRTAAVNDRDRWKLGIDRRVRPFDGVSDLADYWARRQKALGRGFKLDLPTTHQLAESALGVDTSWDGAEVEDEEDLVADESFTVECSLHPMVAEVAESRFESGHFADAVFAAFKAVEHRVQGLTGSTEIGEKLMGIALGTTTPKLIATRSTGGSLQSEQSGMRDLFKGAMQALRNPRGHGPNQADEYAEAQEMLVLASFLMRRLDIAEAAQAAAPANPAAP